MSSDNSVDKSSQILNYFNRQFSYDSKNCCTEHYYDLTQCFDKKKLIISKNEAETETETETINIPKSQDKKNECFQEASSYFLCLTNKMSKYDSL